MNQSTPLRVAPVDATARPWPAERVLLTAFVGINQWLYVTVHACPASVVLGRVGLRATCKW